MGDRSDINLRGADVTATRILDAVHNIVSEAMIGNSGSIPLAFLFFADRDYALVPVPWTDTTMKHVYVQGVGQAARLSGAIGYAFSCEAWVSLYEGKGISGNPNDYPMPRNDPNRKECLVIYAEALRRPLPTEVSFRGWQIVRNETGVVIGLTPLTGEAWDQAKGHGWSGTFGGLLEPPPSRTN